MRNKSKKMVLAVALLAIVVIGVFVTVSIINRGPGYIRIGFNTWVGYGPFYIAKVQGFFEQEGLKVELQRIEGTGERRAALIAGRLEGLGSTIDDLIVGASQGVPARMVLAVDESAGADGILVSKEITTISDLKGKTIAVQPGFVNHFFLLYILDKNGIKPDELKIEPMEPDKAGAAFVARQIDAAVTWEPWLSQAKEREDGKVLLTSSDYPGVIVDILVFRNDIIEKESNMVWKFVRSWYRAVEFLAQNPDEGHRIIAQAMDMKPEEVKDMLSGVKLLKKSENIEYFNRSRSPNVYSVAETANEIWFRQGYIETKQDVEKLIVKDFIE